MHSDPQHMPSCIALLTAAPHTAQSFWAASAANKSLAKVVHLQFQTVSVLASRTRLGCGLRVPSTGVGVSSAGVGVPLASGGAQADAPPPTGGLNSERRPPVKHPRVLDKRLRAAKVNRIGSAAEPSAAALFWAALLVESRRSAPTDACKPASHAWPPAPASDDLLKIMLLRFASISRPLHLTELAALRQTGCTEHRQL